MQNTDRTYSLPQWRLTRWLVSPGRDVPSDIRVELIGGLFGSLPIFFGGIINTLLVAALITVRHPEPLFLVWLVLESLVCVSRIVVLISARKAARLGRPTYTDLYVVLALLWASSVGYGTFISLVSGDWIAATIACLSAASMVGGICVRNFGAPRMSAAMVVLSVGPCALGALFTQEAIFWLVLVQVPLYIASMSMASYRLNAMLVSTMLAEREHERHTRQDSLTGLLNRHGLLRRLDQAVALANPGSAEFAVLYLDLDGFKAVNDTYGHAAGDALLRLVANRVLALLPEGAGAARIGGDEFVLLTQHGDEAEARAFSDRVIESVAQPYDLQQDHPISISGSVGIALIPRHGADTAAVLHAADRALYLAKSAGKRQTAMAQT
ncbi:GGDEF domain-containing protein [Achromobacter seleniivolatilans]|uniref:GGDEF domain-containing protein n=1 Tax=Achromobacter seleniivolatilans TaxID=3047478 RepID=A0ABY9M942_9BURK|nr:GGDEF domain-containing protein [Achromobacter sp. R39]WMD23202.1 GGDEF domain-containing protein [Achromobacter sp. R39]